MDAIISRRAFGVQVGAAAASWMLAKPGQAQSYPPYFDIHTHLGQEWGPRAALSVEQLLHWMDEHHIEHAAVLPLVSPESYDYVISTAFVLEKTAPHRNRLVPFCSMDPRTDYMGTLEKKRELLQKYKDAGARGFGEHKTGVTIDDPRNLEIFHACGELGFPVLFHLDNGRNMDKPGLPGLEMALKQCPQTNFIGHAQGFWASISGDVTQEQLNQYPSTKVTPGGALDRLMDTYPNLYGDLSAGSGANAIARDAEFGREFILRRADRLLFGTDFLAHGQHVPQFSLYENMELPAEVREKIHRANAKRLLGT